MDLGALLNGNASGNGGSGPVDEIAGASSTAMSAARAEAVSVNVNVNGSTSTASTSSSVEQLRGAQAYLEQLAAQSDARRRVIAGEVDAEMQRTVNETAADVAAAATEQQARQANRIVGQGATTTEASINDYGFPAVNGARHPAAATAAAATAPANSVQMLSSTRKRRPPPVTAPAATTSAASSSSSATAARKIGQSNLRHSSTGVDSMPDYGISPAVKAEEVFENAHLDYNNTAGAALSNGHHQVQHRKRDASSAQMSDATTNLDDFSLLEPVSKRARLESADEQEWQPKAEEYEADADHLPATADHGGLISDQAMAELGIAPEDYEAHRAEHQHKYQKEQEKQKQEKQNRIQHMVRFTFASATPILAQAGTSHTERFRGKQSHDQVVELERKIWSAIARSNIPKVSCRMETFEGVIDASHASQVIKAQQQGVHSRVLFHRRLSGAASREGKKYNTRYPRAPKDVQIRARRVMREMMMHLKGQEKGQKETKRKADKEQLEKSRREEEARESQRAARKLNFLITQTELYSHFVGSKLKSESESASASTSVAENAFHQPVRQKRARRRQARVLQTEMAHRHYRRRLRLSKASLTASSKLSTLVMQTRAICFHMLGRMRWQQPRQPEIKQSNSIRPTQPNRQHRRKTMFSKTMMTKA